MNLGDDGVLLLEDGLQLGSQRVPVQEVAHANTGAPGLVDVGRSYAPAGGADGAGAAGLFFQAVQQDVIGHDDMGPLAYMELGRIDAAPPQHIHLVRKHVRVDHHAVADDAVNLGPADAGWDQVELENAFVVHHRVAGIVAAGEAHDAVHLPCKVVYDLPLALVAPLSSDYGVCRHP